MDDWIDVEPFGTEPIVSIPLSRAPLLRVLAQARWQDLVLMRADFASVAQRVGLSLAADYPLGAQNKEVEVTFGPEGFNAVDGGVVHQFISADENWRVYFAANFVTFETKVYTSSQDFLSRFQHVLEKVREAIDIPQVTRVGFRYVNRVDQAIDIAELEDLVRPSMVGAPTGLVQPHAEIAQSINQVVYETQGGQLIAKWALLPAGATHDPSLEPSANKSWTLDLDSFSDGKVAFDPPTLAREAGRLSEMAYRFFRWTVTKKFVERFGG
ncbi:TIGR04255 family protein [Cryobacterium sp. Sr8]|uniref:TIGR04255 family protein n=1 Tax=Cryobacterium sp. Sr8 TaxID=1259203 RepID=UPI00106C0054|nr:TIGR04255 family protein [Cryobacterium sp. Sr8]TFD74875.1 TIGR04255 family protein [Cryobacterium sp. Sr8]